MIQSIADIICIELYIDVVTPEDLIQGLLKNKDRKLAQTFNSSFRYIDDVLSLNISRFGVYLHRIYPNGIEAKSTTDTPK
jgi:hypothetical protein